MMHLPQKQNLCLVLSLRENFLDMQHSLTCLRNDILTNIALAENYRML